MKNKGTPKDFSQQRVIFIIKHDRQLKSFPSIAFKRVKENGEESKLTSWLVLVKVQGSFHLIDIDFAAHTTNHSYVICTPRAAPGPAPSLVLSLVYVNLVSVFLPPTGSSAQSNILLRPGQLRGSACSVFLYHHKALHISRLHSCSACGGIAGA